MQLHHRVGRGNLGQTINDLISHTHVNAGKISQFGQGACLHQTTGKLLVHLMQLPLRRPINEIPHSDFQIAAPVTIHL